MNYEVIARNSADKLAEWFTSFYRDLELMSNHVSESLTRRMGDRSKIIDADLVDLSAISQSFLKEHHTSVGAGVIFAVASVGRPGGLLEWWLRGSDERISKREFNLEPEAEDFYDYEQQPWFTIAARTGHRTLVGPYVDYLGMGEYILTLTVPLYVGDTFVGVTGSDIRVRDLEDVLVPAVREIPSDAALLNSQNRVIVGNSGRFLVGDRVKEIPNDARVMTLDVESVALHLLYLSS